jgi:MtN3 and saliva related transmembrane protein
MKHTDWVGWVSSVILLTTLLRQVYTQWKTRQTAGVSRWLFAGQVAASIGFTVYSLLLGNWIFASSNIAILATAVAGQAILLRNKALKQPRA